MRTFRTDCVENNLTNLCDKPSRLCNKRQRRDEPPVLVVKAVWDLLFLINIHVVHCAQVLIYLNQHIQTF